jgi:hypothetical protein
LTLLYTYGVKTGRISFNKLVDLLATTPAKVNGFGSQIVKEGKYVGQLGEGQFMYRKPYGLCYQQNNRN